MTNDEWKPISTAPEGVLVETKIEDATNGIRNIQKLARFGRLWFFDTEKSGYVYYTPTHWRSVR